MTGTSPLARDPANRLRILHVCPRPNFSGLEAWVLEMARRQSDAGVQVSLVALTGSPLAANAAAFAQINLFKTPQPSMRIPFALAQTVARATGETRPDVIHLHGGQDFNALLPWLVRERFLKQMPKLILQLHIWMSHSKRDPLHSLSYRLIDEIWCSSRLAQKATAELLPIAKDRIRVVHYGRPVAAMQATFLSRTAARAELGIENDAMVVGTVSRIDRGKGTAELLEGTRRVMVDHPRLHLAIIGAPSAGDAREEAFATELQRRTRELPIGMRERVHWLGPKPQSHRLLKAFDFFALPTYSECFSLALMEAQLAALPCIASNAGGSPELVRETETGWLCEPRSAEAFEATLRRALAASIDERARFGAKAKEQIERQYDLIPAIEATIEAYKQIVMS